MLTVPVISVFKVLADENRSKMVWLLGEKEQTVGELEQALGLSQSSTSQHLKILTQSGLVSFRKHGNFRIYALKKEELRAAMSFFDSLWDKGLDRLKQNLEKNE